MERWISVSGLFVMILLAWLMSSDRRHVQRGLVVRGVLLQFLLGGVILWTPPGLERPVGYWLSDLITYLFAQLQTFVQAGSGFLFRLPVEVQSEQRSLQFLFGTMQSATPTRAWRRPRRGYSAPARSRRRRTARRRPSA